MGFLTEKECDYLLELESRELTDKDGKIYDINMSKLYWKSYDIVAKWEPGFASQILESAKIFAEHINHPFSSLVAFRAQNYHSWMYNDLGIDNVDPPPPPVALKF